jgi:TP901 family phage tail tape measure protein
MAIRKAETVYLGDASSVVKAAAAAQKANADYAAKAKLSAKEVVASQDSIVAAGDRAARAAIAAGDSQAKAAAVAGDAALRQSKAVGASTAEQVAAYRKATAAAQKASVDQSAAAAKAAEAQAISGRKINESIASTGASFRKLTTPILLAAGAGVKFAVDFQKSMEQVHTQAGATQGEVKKMSAEVLKMAPATEQGPVALSKALYLLESVGLRGATALAALRAASKGAAVGGADLTDTTDALAGVMVALHEKAGAAAKQMGAIDAVVGVGKMHMQDFVDSLKSGIIPTATAVGLSFNSVTAGLATMTDAGVPAEMAATKMRTILLMLADEHTKRAAFALQSIGLNADDLATAMRKPGNGLLDVLQLLHDRMSGLSKVQQTDIFSSLAGGSRSAGTLITLEQQLGRVGSKYTQIQTLSGQFNARVAAESQTLSHQLNTAWSSVQTTLIQVGTAIMPTVTTLAHDVSMAAAAFTSLPTGLQHAIITGGLIVAGIGPALKILGIFTGGIGKLYEIAKLTSGLIAGTRTLGAASSAGSAGASAASTGVAAGSVATGAGALRSIASRAVGGLAVAGIGVLISQTVGAAIHGSVGDAVKTIGTDASIGAGVGAIFGPTGMAGGALIGGLVGSFKHFIVDNAAEQGKSWADRFVSGMPDVSARIKAKLATATTNAISTPKRPDTSVVQDWGIPGAKQVSDFTNSLANLVGLGSHTSDDVKKQWANWVKAQVQQGQAAGRAVVAELGSVKDVSTPIVLSDFIGRLNQLSTSARPAAAKLMLEYANGLVKNGQLPKSALATIISGLAKQFPGMATTFGDGTKAAVKAVVDNLKFNAATTTLTSTLAGYRKQFGDWAISATLTAANLNSNMTTAMDHLHSIIANSSGQTRKDAVAEYKRLQSETVNSFSAMEAKVASSAASMKRSISTGSQQSASAAIRNFGAFSNAVYQSMKDGVLSTGRGAQLIENALNATLKSFGAKQLGAKIAVSLSGLTAPGGMLGGFAQGGLVQFGTAGARGHDNIGVNFGGTPIRVGSGEVGAVFNHTQQKVANGLLAPVGGLPGLFSNFTTPHYMAKGGMVGGQSLASLNHRFPANGGATLSPTVIAAIAEAAGLPGITFEQISQGESSFQPGAVQKGQPYGTTGWGLWQITPGNSVPSVGIDNALLDPITNARAAKVKYDSQGMGAWFGTKFWDHTIRHWTGQSLGHIAGSVGAALAQIATPKVTGTGTIAAITRAALSKAAAAANAYAQRQQPSGTGSLGSPGGVAGHAGTPFKHGKYDFPLPRGSYTLGAVDQGWDIAAPAHTPEYALADGVVTGHGISGFGPWAPILKLNDGNSVYYGHAGPGNWTKTGTRVRAGQVISEIGAGIVGMSTGPHLEIGFYPPGGAGAGAAMKSALGYARGGMFPFAGSFANGGVVPRTGLALVHKDETIIPAAKGYLSKGTNGYLTAAAAFLYPLDEAIAALTAKIASLQAHGAPNHSKEIGSLTDQLAQIRREKINPPQAHNAAQITNLQSQLAGIRQQRINAPAGKKGSAERKQLADETLAIEQKIKNLKAADSTSVAARRKALANQTLTIEEKIKELKEKDKSAKAGLAATIANLNLQTKNLTQLKSYTDAITTLRTQVKDLAAQAAQAWAAMQTTAINSTHDAAIAAINGGGDATTLAAMQAQDTVTQNAATLAGLQATLVTAQTLVAHSGGQTHLDALQQVKDAQAAIDAFNRQQVEQQLQDNITAATTRADDSQTIALNGLTQQTADYQASLDAQMSALTDSLNARKITYATWAKDVNAILAAYGLSAATDPTTEQTVVTGPGPAGHPAAPVHHSGTGTGISLTWGVGYTRASGGPVMPGYVYRVGEHGPEDVAFGRPGVVQSAGQTRRGAGKGGGDVHIHGNLVVNSTRAVQALADRLAFRAAIGTA